MRHVSILTLISCLIAFVAQAQAAPTGNATPATALAPLSPQPTPAAPAPTVEAQAQAATGAPAASPTPPSPAASAAPAAPAVNPEAPTAPAALASPSPAPAPAPPAYVYSPLPPRVPATPRDRVELERVNERLYALQRERSQYGIGGPIAMTAAGYGSFLLFSLVALTSLGVAEAIESDDVRRRDFDDFDSNDDGTLDSRDERDARRVARGSAVFAAAGLGVGIGGTVFLVKRIAKRRVYAPEIRDLRLRRRELMRSVRYGANVGPGGLQLSLSGRF